MRRPHTSQTHHRVVSTGRCDISRSLVGVIVPTLRRIPAIRTDMMCTNEYVGIPEITKKKKHTVFTISRRYSAWNHFAGARELSWLLVFRSCLMDTEHSTRPWLATHSQQRNSRFFPNFTIKTLDCESEGNTMKYRSPRPKLNTYLITLNCRSGLPSDRVRSSALSAGCGGERDSSSFARGLICAILIDGRPCVRKCSLYLTPTCVRI